MSGVHAGSLVSIEIDGSRFDLPPTASLASVHVRAAFSVPTQFELVIDDPELAIAARFAPGTAIGIRVANHDDLLAQGEVTACEYSYGADRRHQLRVRGYDLLHRLRKRRGTQQHVDVTVVSLARDLTADLGFEVECSAPVLTLPFLIQSRQSDLDLLVDLAGRCGLYLTAHGDRLLLVSLEGIGNPKTLTLGKELLEARAELNAEWSCREVRVSGWNPLLAQEFTARATEPRRGLSVEARVNPDRVGATGVWHLVDEAVQGGDHAQALAQAELDSRAAHEVTLRGVALGDPALRPGVPIDVIGMHAHVGGRYVLTEVQHFLDGQRGFLSQLTSVPPLRQTRPTGAIVALGVVTQVDDPDHLGRVRVKLPAIENVETDWMGVLALGAGKGKGLTILPDVGDSVLVQLCREDPARGLVLGGLWGGHGSPDSGVEGGAVKRFSLMTAGGHRIQVDDKAQTIRVAHETGSYLELGQDRVVLHAKQTLVLEAPGQSVKIRGQAIDFERE
jgi:uncharacterized protein involved in type VI secretion and phage assembly